MRYQVNLIIIRIVFDSQSLYECVTAHACITYIPNFYMLKWNGRLLHCLVSNGANTTMVITDKITTLKKCINRLWR